MAAIGPTESNEELFDRYLNLLANYVGKFGRVKEGCSEALINQIKNFLTENNITQIAVGSVDLSQIPHPISGKLLRIYKKLNISFPAHHVLEAMKNLPITYFAMDSIPINNYADDMATLLCETLPTLPLTHFYLFDCWLKTAEAKQLAPVFKQIPLQRLIIQGNHKADYTMGTEGAISIIENLPIGLKHLDLSGCSLGKGTITALCEKLPDLPALASIDISSNPFFWTKEHPTPCYDEFTLLENTLKKHKNVTSCIFAISPMGFESPSTRIDITPDDLAWAKSINARCELNKAWLKITYQFPFKPVFPQELVNMVLDYVDADLAERSAMTPLFMQHLIPMRPDNREEVQSLLDEMDDSQETDFCKIFPSELKMIKRKEH